MTLAELRSHDKSNQDKATFENKKLKLVYMFISEDEKGARVIDRLLAAHDSKRREVNASLLLSNHNSTDNCGKILTACGAALEQDWPKLKGKSTFIN